MSKVFAIRLAAILIALVAAAWFALGAVQAHDVNRAASILSSARPLTHAQASNVTSLLRTAGTLNPDVEVDVLRAQLKLAEGNKAQAKRILERDAKLEPQNLVPWDMLGRMGDLQALARLAKLDPPVH